MFCGQSNEVKNRSCLQEKVISLQVQNSL